MVAVNSNSYNLDTNIISYHYLSESSFISAKYFFRDPYLYYARYGFFLVARFTSKLISVSIR